jgi:uncharacterized protein YeaO (DUF488 family)
MIRLKRVYEQPAQDDGTRILVERLWPRGLTKESAKIDYWFKDIAPSPELRKWYAHDIARWEEFTERYRLELRNNPKVVRLQQVIKEKGLVTFVLAARDIDHSSARLLRDYLLEADDVNNRI